MAIDPRYASKPKLSAVTTAALNSQIVDGVACNCTGCAGRLVRRDTEKAHRTKARFWEVQASYPQLESTIASRTLQDTLTPEVRERWQPRVLIIPPEVPTPRPDFARPERRRIDASSRLQELSKTCDTLLTLPLASPKALIFRVPPTAKSPPVAMTQGVDATLDSSHSANIWFLAHYRALNETLLQLGAADDCNVPELRNMKEVLADSITARIHRMDRMREVEWGQQRLRAVTAGEKAGIPVVITGMQELFLMDFLGTESLYTDHHFEGSRDSHGILQLAVYLILMVSYLIFHATESHCNYLAKSTEALLTLSLVVNGGQAPEPYTVVYSISRIIKMFNIRPELEEYACCSLCCAIYPPVDGVFPERCDNIRTILKNENNKQARLKRKKRAAQHKQIEPKPGEPCGAELSRWMRRKGDAILRPRRAFHYQSLKKWLGRLLSRPGVEEAMERSVEKARLRKNPGDIWEAAYVQELKGKDSLPFFSKEALKKEGRLLFSLGIDWFNALHSGVAKKTWSIGGIYAVCLNLPPSIRFKPENICLVGIIPGPNKPGGTEIDHFLTPIVDELLEFFNTGVWFSKTLLHPMGRLIRAVLGPLVCDLDACREIAGFTTISHRLLCSYCLINKSDINNFEESTWPKRDLESHRTAAAEWEAASVAEKHRITEETGLRWSPLLCLPYWNPLRCTVLDVMHNKYLGNLQKHFRQIWGLSLEVDGGDGSALVMSGKVPADERMKVVRQALQEGSIKSLYQSELEVLCHECGIVDKLGGQRTKAVMIRELEAWVSNSIANDLTNTNLRRSQRIENDSGGVWKSDGKVKTANAAHQLRDAQLLLERTPQSEWNTLKKTTLFLVAQARQTPDSPKISKTMSTLR